MIIHFDIFCDYIKKNTNIPLTNKEEIKDYYKWQNEQFEIMKKLKWEDFTKLNKNDLEKIPICWLYDWNKVTGEVENDDKILELYTKNNLTPLTPKEYLNKFDKPIQYDDVHKILPTLELKDYIKNYLIKNDDFINDVDACMWQKSSDNKLINKSINERVDYFNNTIGNESRTYILKILTLKHLIKILLKNLDGFTDEFWRNRLNMVLQKDDINKEHNNYIEEKLLEKFPNKTIEEILKLPVEAILEFSAENDKEFKTNNIIINEIITNKSVENNQNKVIFEKPSAEDKIQRIKELAMQEKLSISTLQRLFYISYPKAVSVINNLMKNNIIEKLENGYKIIDKQKLKNELINVFDKK